MLRNVAQHVCQLIRPPLSPLDEIPRCILGPDVLVYPVVLVSGYVIYACPQSFRRATGAVHIVHESFAIDGAVYRVALDLFLLYMQQVVLESPAYSVVASNNIIIFAKINLVLLSGSKGHTAGRLLRQFAPSAPYSTATRGHVPDLSAPIDTLQLRERPELQTGASD